MEEFGAFGGGITYIAIQVKKALATPPEMAAGSVESLVLAAAPAASASEVVTPPPALQPSEPLSAAPGGKGEGSAAPPSQREKSKAETLARDLGFLLRAKELREEDPSRNNRNIARLIAKEAAAEGRMISPETVRRITQNLSKRPDLPELLKSLMNPRPKRAAPSK